MEISALELETLLFGQEKICNELREFFELKNKICAIRVIRCESWLVPACPG